jgi:SAM-dependent methyltransferase
MDSEQIDGWDQESERAWKNDSKDLEFPENVVKVLKHLVPVPARVLDSGCGIGKHLRTFTKLGYIAVGVEQSKVGAGYAKQLNPQIQILNIRIQELTFKNEFHMIFTSAVLQHSLHERQVVILQKFYDALKSNGIYFCTENTLTEQNASVHFKKTAAGGFEPVAFSEDASDGYSFTEKGWIKFLAEQGFQHIQTIWPWPFYFYRKVEK